MNKTIANKRFMGTLVGLSVTVVMLGEVSVDKGIIAFAQGQTDECIVAPIEVNGMTLESFSKIPDIMDSIVFTEDTNSLDGFKTTENVTDDSKGGIRPLSISQNDNAGEESLLEEYGINVKVETNNTVGVGSEVNSILKSSVSKDDYNTLLKVRNAARHKDQGYKGKVVNIKGKNRDYVERLVMGEAGNQGFVGACLVAQTIRDTMIADNEYDLLTIKRTHAYSGALTIEPCQTVKDAVAYIFDEGGYAVQHSLMYFYAPKLVDSRFHESQEFIVEHGGHRFFDRVVTE